MSRFREKPAFAACIARGMTWAAAARHCNVSRQVAYNWLRNDPEFAALIDDAERQRRDFAESKLYKMVDAEYFPAVAYALTHWWPEKYGKVRVAVGGDPNAPPVGVVQRFDTDGTPIVNNILFRLPPNNRDKREPEGEVVLDAEPEPRRTIEGGECADVSGEEAAPLSESDERRSVGGT
jgi:hypothetical protein